MLRLILCSLLFLHSYAQHDYDEEGWKKASEFIRTGLKENAEPCDDFFNYACGNWNQTEGTDSEDENARLSAYTDARLLEAIKGINIRDASTPKYATRLKVFHDQCISNNYTNVQIIQQFYQGIERVLGRPPIFAKNESEKQKVLSKNIWNMLGFIQRELAFGVLFDTTIIAVTSEENQANMEYVVQFEPAVVQNMMTEDSIMKNVKQIAAAIGVSVNETELKEKTLKVIKFSEALQQYHNKSEIKEAEKIKANHDKTLNSQILEAVDEEGDEVKTFTLEELIKLNPSIQWSEFFKGLLSEEQLANWKGTNRRFIVNKISYFEELTEIVAATELETIFDFTFWKALTQLYSATATSDDEEEDAVVECLGVVKKLFSPAATKVLFNVNNWDPVLWRTDIEMIGETVFAAFKFLIQAADWLDNEEKINIMKKVNYISFYSGIPDWLSNDTQIDEQTFEIDPNRPLFENVFNIRRQLFDANLDQLTGLAEALEANPNFDNNAFYGGMRIEVCLGSVMPPMYHPKYPMSVKYGILGWTFGHELLHAFDENHIDEIPPTTSFLIKAANKESYARKKGCLVKQYASYCYKDRKKCVSGTKTLGENMADIDGLKIAYMAYKFAAQTTDGEPRLPNLFDFSGDKIFFLAAGRSYCSRDRFLDIFLGDNPDEHSPNRPRVDISVRNFPAFARIFDCRAGSAAMPQKTCSIWGNFNSPPTNRLFR